MKTGNVPERLVTRLNSLILIGVFIILAAAVAVPFYAAASSSLSPDKTARASASREVAAKTNQGLANRTLWPSNYRSLPLMPQGGETIATFEVVAGVCTATAKNSFNLGETVCAKITGAPLGTVDRAATRIGWVSPYGSLTQGAEITTDPQNGFYLIPSTATQTFTDAGGSTVTVDNRGTWAVGVYSASDGSLRETALFTVHDPAKAFVDLSVHQAVTTDESQVGAGSGSVFELFVTNRGPDAAQDVVLSDTLSDNATFSSIVENTPQLGFSCGTPVGTVFTCNLASMPAGATAHLTLSYTVNGDTPAGATITNTASVSSSATPCSPDATCELQPNDNSSTASAEVPTAVGGQTCTLDCHDNISVIADATQMGNPGAFVSFGAATTSGNCGVITATFNGLPPGQPASGAFYPVGTTLVSVTSETGNGSCSFTVTVVQATPPTITCPPNKSVSVAQNATSATVDPGTPTTNPSTGVTVVGVRSDSPNCTDTGCTPVLLTDPYPIGVTLITWTVTDANGLTASCTQTITVNQFGCGPGEDTTPPTITAPPDVNVSTVPTTSSCGTTVEESLLGTPTASDNCSVNVSRSGVPAGNFFPVGMTTITYTATDGAGNTATATQHVTVTDATPPIIVAPADASYTCPEQVPAADPSQAHGPDVIVNGQPQPGPVFDNCGVQSVTVSQTSSGAGSAADPRIITRTYTATDIHGNTASAVQTITVTDGTPPTITAPPNVSANTGPGATSCDTVVNNATLGTASAQDNCAGVTVSRSPSGNTFPVGTTTITWTATDWAGNTATATQTVTVVDNTPPVVTPPANVTAYTGAGATSCGTVVMDATLGSATATDNCPGVSGVTRTGVPSGNVFPVGTTTITYSATDAHGNSSSATQTVTVIDNTPPVISCPANIVLEPTCPSGAIATYTAPVGTDNCPGATTARTAGLASGSVFPIGTTTVTYTVTDAASNSTSCSFTVTVKTPQATIQDMINAVNAISSLSGSQKQGLINQLQQALDALNAGSTSGACGKLNQFISKVQTYINNGTLTSAQGQPLINSANHVINTLGCTNNPCT